MNKSFFSKSILLTIIIFVFRINSLQAQSNLELANKYYNSDDYQNSANFYKKTIFEDNKYDGTIFYRYAYSMEQNKLPEKDYAFYYSAAAYLFEQENQINTKYYSFAIAKEETLGISHNNFSDNTIKKILAGKTIRSKNIFYSIADSIINETIEITENLTKEWLIIFIAIIIVIYIIGRIFSSKTECVIFSSLKEIVLLFLPFIFFLILAIISITTVELNSSVCSLLTVIFFLISFISAIVFSIYDNLGTKFSVLYIIISLITKLALCIMSPLILLLCLAGMKEEKEDRRFGDGTKNNQKTKNATFFASMLALFIFSLLKLPSRKVKEDIADW